MEWILDFFTAIGFAVVCITLCAVIWSILRRFWDWFIYERMCPRCREDLQNKNNQKIAEPLHYPTKEQRR